MMLKEMKVLLNEIYIQVRLIPITYKVTFTCSFFGCFFFFFFFFGGGGGGGGGGVLLYSFDVLMLANFQ